MATFAEAATDAVRRSFCLATGRLGVWSEMVLGGDNPLGAASQAASGFLQGLACNRPAPPLALPPFEGGQCAFLYNIGVRCTYSGSAAPSGTLVNVQAFGQIRGVRFEQAPGNAAILYIQGGNPAGSSSGEQNVGSTVYSFSPSDFMVSVAIESITPASGSNLDTCGNPPDVRPPYNPGDSTVGDTITYNSDDDTEFNIDVDINFGYPQISFNNQFNIPFTMVNNAIGGFVINGNLNLSTGDITFGGGGAPPGTSDCEPGNDQYKPEDDPPDPPTDVDTGAEDPPIDPEKPQRKRQIQACVVTVTETPANILVIPQDENPDVYGRDLGLVSFRIDIGGFRAWTEDIPVKNKRQFIPCPWAGGASAVKGTPRPGADFVITPIYVRVTDQQTYLE